MASPEPIVVARGLEKRFGDRLAVAGLDLDVPQGACYGVLGPNGAGKTTTLRMVYGVSRPTRGELRVFGLDVAREGRKVRAGASPIDPARSSQRHDLHRQGIASNRSERVALDRGYRLVAIPPRPGLRAWGGRRPDLPRPP